MSTGDMNGAGSKTDRLTATPDEDPFADLAKLIDQPWGAEPAMRAERDTAAAPTGDATGFDEEALAGVLDEEFNRSFESMDDFAAPAMAADAPSRDDETITNSYANWVSPRGASAASTGFASQSRSATPPAAPEAQLDAAIDDELEVALRGLSAPANPRGTPLHHSEAFAPARVEPAPMPQASTKPLDDFDELIASELAAMTTTPQVQRVNEAWDGADTRMAATGPSAPQHGHAGLAQDDSNAFGVESLDDRFDDGRGVRGASHRAAGAMLAAGQGRFSPRSLGFGASVLVIALLGGVGAYYASGSGGVAGSDEVLIVRADPEPVKVAPKDPGGRAVPNQNKAVYERVQSADADIKPSQTTLLSAAEEPLELPSQVANDLPGVDLSPIGTARAASNGIGDGSVRVADASASAEPIAVLTPRRVRTLTVRPDGTLVTEDTVPETSMADLRGENPAMIPAASRPVELATDAADVATTETVDDTASAGQPAPGMPVPAMKPTRPASAATRVAALATAEPEPQVSPAAVSPAPTPVAPEPAVDSATETASIAAQPAAAPAAVTAPAGDGYYVQISSQPSETAARESSQALGQRYAGVIGGRNLVIQSADIPGKGTYYRVRVATGSKDEATSLCSQLKSAGGSCFVAR
ncbi:MULTISPECIES: SPOR domain-containing protein [Aurantimonas]|uniref:SPOR domain-containing protein n=1 Tax=Aurantimonas TaxID=182269 RepID=UPI003512892B